MATAEYKATINASGSVTTAGSGLVTSAVSSAATASSAGTHGAAFTTALATLVADGASPTQAHVNAVNSAWTTYKADIDAATAAGAAITPDMTLYIGSLANVSDINKVRRAFRALERLLEGSNIVAQGSANP